jgi:hypothetical protein
MYGKVGADEPRNPDVQGTHIPGFMALLLRTYRFDYELSALSQRSQLVRLQECDGIGECKYPLEFDYHEYAHPEWRARHTEQYEEVDVKLPNIGADDALRTMGLGAGRVGLEYHYENTLSNLEMVETDEDYTNGTGSHPVFSGVDRFNVISFREPNDVKSPRVTSQWANYVWSPGNCGQRSKARQGGPTTADWSGNGVSEVSPLSCGPTRLTARPHPDTGKVWTPTVTRMTLPHNPAFRHFVPESEALPPSRSGMYWLDLDGDRNNDLAWVEIVGSPEPGHLDVVS